MMMMLRRFRAHLGRGSWHTAVLCKGRDNGEGMKIKVVRWGEERGMCG